MAFIRDYANMAGDGFFRKLRKRLKPPRFIRKFQPGKFALQAAQFIPGPLGTVASMYPYAAGDPRPSAARRGKGGPKPKPGKKAKAVVPHPAARKKEPKRKGAGRGTRSKSKAKGKGVDWSGIGGAIGGALPGIIDVVGGIGRGEMPVPGQGGVIDDDGSGAALEDLIRRQHGLPAIHGHRGFGHHRKMNFANVKALRRASRRAEGFQRLVQSVYRGFPALRPHTPARAHHSRGHKRGCRCVACRGRR